MTGRAALWLVVAASCLGGLPVAAQDRTPGLSYGVEVGAQWVFQDNAFWRLSDTFATGTPFEAAPNWGEGYIKPYLAFSSELDSGLTLYGRGSFIASGTFGTDVFSQSDDTEVLPEEAVFGIDIPVSGGGSLDLSAGSQAYEIGTGMLIAFGSGNGFERGALILGPRKAWEMTGILGYSDEATTLSAFYLDPRELASNDTDTTLAGVTVTHSYGEALSLGAMGGVVLTSDAPWVQAGPDGLGVPSIIPGGRDGMRFVNLWGTWTPSSQVTISGDLAYEANDTPDMEAWGGRIVGTYAASEMPFKPVFGYSMQTFSGDDPSTTRLERFDPLFYNSSPSGWGSGANASFVFLNSNVTAHQLFAQMTVSDRDFLTLRYYHIRANELLSPLQFGQGTRLIVNGTPTLVSGVTDAHLSDDIYAEYTRVITPTTYLTAGVTISFPGDGIVELRGGQSNSWAGGYVNIVSRF